MLESNICVIESTSASRNIGYGKPINYKEGWRVTQAEMDCVTSSDQDFFIVHSSVRSLAQAIEIGTFIDQSVRT